MCRDAERVRSLMGVRYADEEAVVEKRKTKGNKKSSASPFTSYEDYEHLMEDDNQADDKRTEEPSSQKKRKRKTKKDDDNKTEEPSSKKSKSKKESAANAKAEKKSPSVKAGKIIHYTTLCDAQKYYGALVG